MAGLTKLVSLASNTTKLDDVTKNNATKIAEIQAKASSASKQLTTLQSNTTLVSECATIDAAQKTAEDCHEMKSMQKLISLASNTTKLDDVTKNNATKIAEIQAKASTVATKLKTLTSNTTLVSACSAIASSKASEKGRFTKCCNEIHANYSRYQESRCFIGVILNLCCCCLEHIQKQCGEQPECFD
jgi:ABC-type enterochelin transport system substrate-binding protein